ETAQLSGSATVLGEFAVVAREVSLLFCQLGVEAFLQSEGVSRGAGKVGQDAVLVETPHLACRALDDDIAQGHLTIAAQGDLVTAPNAQYGGSVKLFHGIFLLKTPSGDGMRGFK